jgi:hypothetical protein
MEVFRCKIKKVIIKKNMNRDYPLAPTVFKDKETRMKKKAARQENNQIKKEERVEMRKYRKIERSDGLEYEPPVRKRHMR